MSVEKTCDLCGKKITVEEKSGHVDIYSRNKISMEHREFMLGENRGSNLIRLTQEAFAFRQG